jgi:hypothetical protein
VGIRAADATGGDPAAASIRSVTTPAAPFPIDVSVAPALRHARWRHWWRGGWPPLLVALACAGSYALFLVLPYYVNDLDRFPLEEVAMGYHDPKDLWPHAQGGWASFRLAGMATFLLGPALALATLAWAVVRTRQGIAAGDLRRTAPALVAAAVAIGTIGWLFSPFGRALMSWFLD